MFVLDNVPRASTSRLLLSKCIRHSRPDLTPKVRWPQMQKSIQGRIPCRNIIRTSRYKLQGTILAYVRLTRTKPCPTCISGMSRRALSHTTMQRRHWTEANTSIHLYLGTMHLNKRLHTGILQTYRTVSPSQRYYYKHIPLVLFFML